MEDVHHFVMDCPRYAAKRASLIAQVGRIISGSAYNLPVTAFEHMSSQEQCEVILGKRIGDPIAENRIDASAKRYLTKAWNLRAGVTASINAAFGTAYEVCPGQMAR